jgi:hypothetical protein
MPRPDGKSWRVVDGIAFAAGGLPAQAAHAIMPVTQKNASVCCFGARTCVRA